MPTHTPTPWSVEVDYADDTGAEYTIIGADGSIVTYLDGDGNERLDAERIAAAVNAHNDLLEVLKGVVRASYSSNPVVWAGAIEACSAAIAKATGEGE